jgi:probable phosphoglycerate mutase
MPAPAPPGPRDPGAFVSEPTGSLHAMPRATTLHLFRHGESEANAGERTLAPDSASLTAIGARQAAAIAVALDRAPSLIVVSSHRRARQTAAPTCARFPDAPLEVWPVEEFHYLGAGAYRGTTKRDRRPSVAEYWSACDPSRECEPGAESFVAFVARLLAVRDRLERADAPRIAVFSHKKFLHGLLWSWREGRPEPDAAAMARFRAYDRDEPFPNGAGVDVELSGGVARAGPLRVPDLPADVT